MRVPVLDTKMRPLMPCMPERARHLLNQGKARAYWNKLGVFCIILKREVVLFIFHPISDEPENGNDE